ncbi:MAG: aquaporin family protein [Aestuariivita sp.]|nr:aquaporin family protein [Aestuariivita sp.]
MKKKIVAEFLGTAFLLIGVVGSGIMAERLSGDQTAIALLANAIATGCILYSIITVLAPISGAHFNPAVTIAFLLRRELTLFTSLAFICAQIFGGIFGVWASHVMFDLNILQTSTNIYRTGQAQWVAEVIATFGLLFVIFGGLKSRPDAIPALVALYITGAYWFTASTSFANPAVTIARGFTDTFTGIHLDHITGFIIAQFIGVIIAHISLRSLFAK